MERLVSARHVILVAFIDALVSTASYADFIVISLMHFIKRINEKQFDRMMATDPAFTELYTACDKWLAKDQ